MSDFRLLDKEAWDRSRAIFDEFERVTASAAQAPEGQQDAIAERAMELIQLYFIECAKAVGPVATKTKLAQVLDEMRPTGMRAIAANIVSQAATDACSQLAKDN